MNRITDITNITGITSVALGGGVSNEPEVDTLIAKVTTPLSNGYISKLNTLLSTIKTGLGITLLNEAFDCLWIQGSETEESSVYNIAKSAHDLTPVNSPTWSQYDGIQLNGTTQYLNTNFNPATQGVKYTLNNCSAFFYSNTDTIKSAYDIGLRVGGDYVYIMSYLAGNTNIRINSSGSLVISSLGTDGMIFAQRPDASTIEYYVDKVKNSASVAATTIPSDTVFIGARHYGATIDGNSDRQYAVTGFGRSFTETEIGVITDAFNVFFF